VQAPVPSTSAQLHVLALPAAFASTAFVHVAALIVHFHLELVASTVQVEQEGYFGLA
jgi:hypothetical protein